MRKALRLLLKTVSLLSVFFLTLPLMADALAASPIARIDDRDFTSVSSVWSYAMSHNNSVIEMLADWKLSERLTVKEGIAVTIHMHYHMINRGNINRSKPDYGSDSGGDGGVFWLDDKSSLTIFGRDVGDAVLQYAGALVSKKNIWVYDSNGDVMLDGGLITGGATDSDAGGAFTIEENAKLDMRDVTVAGNIADEYGSLYGRGGAILAEDDNSTVYMDGCVIAYNYAEWEGGAICVDDGENVRLTMKNSQIMNNWCDERGGGICVPSGGEGAVISLRSTIVSGNTAKTGGGLYLDEENITVQNGTIKENTATEYAGGIYIGDTDCTLQDVTVISNTAKECAGIELTETITGEGENTLYLTGTLCIRENTTTSGKKSNLVLEGSDGLFTNRAKILGIPSDNSEIWISNEEDGELTTMAARYNDDVFHADDSSKVIFWDLSGNSESNKYYRYLKIGSSKGSQPSQVTLPKEVLNPTDISPNAGGLTLTDYTYNGWKVYRGYGGTDSTDLVGPYYYSDGYFLDNPNEYNEHLATLSLRLAMAAMNSSVWRDANKNERSYTLQPNHIKQMLSDIGVAEKNIFLSDTYLVKPGTDTIGYALGAKPLLDENGKDTGDVLIPIAVRGAGYEAEWTSNVTLGGDSNTEHQGFREAADQVLEGLEDYIDSHGLREKANNGRLRFWVVGFSRAGATANLVAKSLVEKYKPKYNQVFGYSFEAPQGGMASSMTMMMEDYYCIHNVLLAADLVPHVAMTTMNFQRYGVDHYLPGTEASSPSVYFRRYSGVLSGEDKPNTYEGDSSIPFLKDNDYYDTDTAEYKAQKKLMLYQLAGSDHSIVFDDYFHLATFSFLETVLGDGYIVEFGSSKVTAAQWLPDFIYYINEWLTGTSWARSKYAQEYEAIARNLMEASNTGTLNLENAKDRLLNANLIEEIVGLIMISDETWDNIHKDPYGHSYSKEQALGDILEKAGVIGADSIPITADQVVPALGMILNIINGDLTDVGEYRLGTSIDYGDENEYLVMLATLLYNSDTILQNHNHQVVYAWLRSDDCYYLENKDGATDNWYTVRYASSDEVDTPTLTLKVNGVEKTMQANDKLVLAAGDALTDVQLHMSDRNAGGQVFYSIDENAFYPETHNADAYYGGERLLDEEVNTALNSMGSLTLSAETVWYCRPSAMANFCITRDSTLHSVYVDNSIYGVFKTGDSVSITAEAKDCYEFVQWNYREVKTPAVAASGPKLASAPLYTNPTITFTMPDADVYLDTNYKQLQVKTPLSTLPELAAGKVYSTDRTMTLYTPSGTEDEGFTITYIAVLEDDSGLHGVETGNQSDFTIYSFAVNDTANYDSTRWTITVTAEKEGWLPSEPAVFRYTVDYRAKEYVLEVVNGTIAQGSQSGATYGTFKPGDLVSLQADSKSGMHFTLWTDKQETAGLSRSALPLTTFRMPFDDVDAQALFSANPPPETGDSTPLALWIGLGSSCLLFGIVLLHRRKKR